MKLKKLSIYRICLLLLISIAVYFSFRIISDSFVIPDDKYIRAIRLEKFIDRFNKGFTDRVLIVKSTIEGGYVISELTFSRKEITLNIDNSGDGYVTEQKQSITCKNIKRVIKNLNIVYMLDHCENLSAEEEIPVISLGMK